MGFVRLKTEVKRGKKYQYYYYAVRRRSGIKDGGNGKVKSPDKLIGDHPVKGQYLEFWLWDGLSLIDYAEAMIAYQLKDSVLNGSLRLSDYLKWWIEWKTRKGKPTAAKLKFRAVVKDGLSIDARASYPKKVKEYLQNWLDGLIQIQDSIKDSIEAIAASLARHELFKQYKAKEEADYKKWKSDPYREWEECGVNYFYSKEYGDQCLEIIEVCQKFADIALENYETAIANLLNKAPPRQRERFKAAIIHQSEKLAASPNFLDRYETK